MKMILPGMRISMHVTDQIPAIGLLFIKCPKFRSVDIWQPSRQRHYSQRPRLDHVPANVDHIPKLPMAILHLTAFSKKHSPTIKFERAKALLPTDLGTGGNPATFCPRRKPLVNLLYVGQFRSCLMLKMLL